MYNNFKLRFLIFRKGDFCAVDFFARCNACYEHHYYTGTKNLKLVHLDDLTD